MTKNKSIQEEIRNLYQQKRFGVFGSIWQKQSYQSLVCFAVTENLKFILFGTPRKSRKLIDSRGLDRFSLFVDSTTNDPRDLSQAITVTAIGKVYDGDTFPKDTYDDFLQVYLTKHPYLESFIRTPKTQMVVLEVDHYLFVHNFERVIEWSPLSAQDQEKSPENRE